MSEAAEELPHWAESHKQIQLVDEEKLPNSDLKLTLIVRPIKPAQESIPVEVLKKRWMLEMQGAFKKVFVEDWRMSMRMGEQIWSDVEKELGK